GPPDQAADKFTNAAAAAIVAFHATPKGGNVTSANPTANADCSTSSTESTNPSEAIGPNAPAGGHPCFRRGLCRRRVRDRAQNYKLRARPGCGDEPLYGRTDA